jgi:hypothetical protein
LPFSAAFFSREKATNWSGFMLAVTVLSFMMSFSLQTETISYQWMGASMNCVSTLGIAESFLGHIISIDKPINSPAWVGFYWNLSRTFHAYRYGVKNRLKMLN